MTSYYNGRSWLSANSVPPSCVHDAFRRVQDQDCIDRSPIIRLHLGEPHFDPPVEVVDALFRAVREQRAFYTAVEGLLELRASIASKLAECNHINTSLERIFVCPGSTEGLMAVMRALWEPDAEILLPGIHWPIHFQQSLLAGLRPVFYPLATDFQLSIDAVASMATSRTRILLINSPANPTGAVYDTLTLKALLNLARERGWRIIADEAYEDFVYEGSHVSIASLEQDCREKERCVFSVFSFSKSYAMTGYRLGYVAVPNASAARALQVVQEATILSAASPIQFAGLAALSAKAAIVESRRRLLEAKKVIRSAALDGWLCTRPQGGWYTLLNVERTGLSGDQFATFLLREQNVAVVPAAGFALRPAYAADGSLLGTVSDPVARHLIRIAFCGDTCRLKEGLSRIRAFLLKFGRIDKTCPQPNTL